MNSYLTNRLLATMSSPAIASLLSGTIFAALHWPNPVLIPLTFIGGTAMAWLFARDRNIIPLAIGKESWDFSLVGVSDGVAPRHGRGARFLYVSSAIGSPALQIQVAVFCRGCHASAKSAIPFRIVVPDAGQSLNRTPGKHPPEAIVQNIVPRAAN